MQTSLDAATILSVVGADHESSVHEVIVFVLAFAFSLAVSVAVVELIWKVA